MANFQTGRHLKVAIFSDDFSPGADGAVFDLARGLVAEGAEVDVFSLRSPDEPGDETIEGVLVHRTGANNLTKLLQIYGVISPKLLPRAYGSLRENPPDVIHAFGTTFSALVAAGVSRVLKHPLVTTLQPRLAGEGRTLSRRVPAFAYERSFGRAIVSSSDRVVCTSAAGVVQAAKYGARSERTIIQPAESGSQHRVRQTIDVYVDALAERELRWFLQEQAA